MSDSDPAVIQSRLAEPFEANEIKWKPAMVKGDRALALAYIDARLVMDRLDDVVGVGNWQDSYEQLSDGNVACTLRVRIAGEWISKTDVGGESEQPDDGDKCKAAFSDALKRAAVKFGVGRFLYRLPQQWVDYDPQRRQFKRTPGLPTWLSKPAPAAPPPKPDPVRQIAAKLDATVVSDRGELITAEHAQELESFLDAVWLKPDDFLRAFDLRQTEDMEAGIYPVAYAALTTLRGIRTRAEKLGVTLNRILSRYPDATCLFDLSHEQLLEVSRSLDKTAKKQQQEPVTQGA